MLLNILMFFYLLDCDYLSKVLSQICQFNYKLMEYKARHINFNKFIQDRSVEISKFLVDLELDTKKKGHQALQKSVRRRAMSHNRYRIPRRLRKNMEEDLAKAQSMQKLPKCRKHIRKRRHLITAYKMRSNKIQWLSTHLWAARRMKMINYYGFKVALTPNNKSFRSAYRHTKHGCTIADLSYYYAVTLISKENKVELPQFIKLNQYPLRGKIYEGEIVNLQTLVCPCFLVRSQSATSITLRVLFHPAALEEVKKIGIPPGWSASMQQGQVDIYYLNGPQSLSILEEALKLYGMIQSEQSITNKFYARESPVVYFNLPSNNYSLTNKPLIDSPISVQKTLIQGYNASSNSSIRTQMMSIFTSLTNQKTQQTKVQQKAFWEIFDEGQNQEIEKTIFKITPRSRYTHRRKNKLSKEQKKVAVKAERQSSSQRGKGRMREESQEAGQSSYQQKRIFVESSTVKKQNAVLQPVHPLMIASLHPDSYLVWANNADSCRFWRILSKLNIKIIGRKELNHLSLEKGKRNFPEDYPQTECYKIYREEQLKKGFEKYIKFPLQKRVNFLKLRSPFPFAGFIPKQPKMVELQIVSRGHCEPFSYICELESQDLNTISKQIESGHSGTVCCQQGEGQRKKYGKLSELEDDLKKVNPLRKIIGQITSGGYRYSRSREGGIGFIDETLVSSNYLNDFEGYILVRKVNSPFYILAQILKIISSN